MNPFQKDEDAAMRPADRLDFSAIIRMYRKEADAA